MRIRGQQILQRLWDGNDHQRRFERKAEGEHRPVTPPQAAQHAQRIAMVGNRLNELR